MKKSTSFRNLLFVFTITAFLSCEKEKIDPEIPNESELITTLKVVFVSSAGDTGVFQFQDPDGDGGIAPSITNDTLKANTEYKLSYLILRDESTATPIEINTEILEEADEHQFFFIPENTLNLDFSYRDSDKNGKPLGIQFDAKAGTKSKGNLRIVLRHLPNKAAAGVSDGDISNAGGESDIEVDFQVVID